MGVARPLDRRTAADEAASGRGEPATGESGGPGAAPAPPESDVAGRDQGEAVGPLPLCPGLAGAGLGGGRVCLRRTAQAVDRGASRRQDPVRLLEPAGGDESARSSPALEEPL